VPRTSKLEQGGPPQFYRKRIRLKEGREASLDLGAEVRYEVRRYSGKMVDKRRGAKRRLGEGGKKTGGAGASAALAAPSSERGTGGGQEEPKRGGEPVHFTLNKLDR
jgi:hypothetical protein